MHAAALVPDGIITVGGLDIGVWLADIMVGGVVVDAVAGGPDETAFENARRTACDTCSDTIVNILDISIPAEPGVVVSLSPDPDDPGVIAVDGIGGALPVAGAAGVTVVAGTLEVPVDIIVVVVVDPAVPASDILISNIMCIVLFHRCPPWFIDSRHCL